MQGRLAGFRLRTLRTLRREPISPARADGEACSWEAMAAVYREQAARGEPEAIRGLALIEQDRWPSSGRPRKG
jgi:hypothetical protein